VALWQLVLLLLEGAVALLLLLGWFMV